MVDRHTTMKNTLRSLLIVEWLLIGASVGVGFALENRLPATLQEWLATEGSAVSVTAVGLYVAVLIASIVSTVGLFWMQRWAAWLFLLSTLFATFGDWSPVVQHPAEAMIGELSLLVAGAVIGISFFSGIMSSSKRLNQAVQTASGLHPSRSDL